jgi:hypothetical protein
MKTEYTDDDLQCVVDDICPVVDLEWYAVDIHGYLAAFTTAGNGPVPVSVLQDFAAFRRIQDAIYKLPFSGTAEWLVEKPPKPQALDELARRGLWVYDWPVAARSRTQAAYGLHCRPTVPVIFASLPREVEMLVRRTTLGISFKDTIQATIGDAQPEGPCYGSQARRT